MNLKDELRKRADSMPHDSGKYAVLIRIANGINDNATLHEDQEIFVEDALRLADDMKNIPGGKKAYDKAVTELALNIATYINTAV